MTLFVVKPRLHWACELQILCSLGCSTKILVFNLITQFNTKVGKFVYLLKSCVHLPGLCMLYIKEDQSSSGASHTASLVQETGGRGF